MFICHMLLSLIRGCAIPCLDSKNASIVVLVCWLLNRKLDLSFYILGKPNWLAQRLSIEFVNATHWVFSRYRTICKIFNLRWAPAVFIITVSPLSFTSTRNPMFVIIEPSGKLQPFNFLIGYCPYLIRFEWQILLVLTKFQTKSLFKFF